MNIGVELNDTPYTWRAKGEFYIYVLPFSNHGTLLMDAWSLIAGKEKTSTTPNFNSLITNTKAQLLAVSRIFQTIVFLKTPSGIFWLGQLIANALSRFILTLCLTLVFNTFSYIFIYFMSLFNTALPNVVYL